MAIKSLFSFLCLQGIYKKKQGTIKIEKALKKWGRSPEKDGLPVVCHFKFFLVFRFWFVCFEHYDVLSYLWQAGELYAMLEIVHRSARQGQTVKQILFPLFYGSNLFNDFLKDSFCQGWWQKGKAQQVKG